MKREISQKLHPAYAVSSSTKKLRSFFFLGPATGLEFRLAPFALTCQQVLTAFRLEPRYIGSHFFRFFLLFGLPINKSSLWAPNKQNHGLSSVSAEVPKVLFWARFGSREKKTPARRIEQRSHSKKLFLPLYRLAFWKSGPLTRERTCCVSCRLVGENLGLKMKTWSQCFFLADLPRILKNGRSQGKSPRSRGKQRAVWEFPSFS